MSRLTAAQVIALGEYLEPSFDASSLTVAQLLGVFGYHNVSYPSQYTKPKLVQLFNDEIKTNATRLRRQRLKKENSQASDDGITDGLTGLPINEGKKPVTRRSTRHLSQAPPAQTDPEPAPAKRRRSTAEPTLGGPSRRRGKSAKPADPVLVEESEPEEVAPRKVGRSKKSTTDAGSQARRVSQTFVEDSGWEDNNVFQSGPESPSPVRPPPRRTRRLSAAPRPASKSRKSMSAPPQYKSESPERETEPVMPSRSKPPSSAKPRSSVKPPSSAFEPQLPPDVPRETRAASRSRTPVAPETKQERLFLIPSQVTEEEEPEQETDVREQQQMEALQQDIVSPETAVEPFSAEEHEGGQQRLDGASESEEYTDEQVLAVSKRLSGGGQVARHQPESEPRGPSRVTRLVFLLFVALSSGLLYEYKQESSQIGFCTAGTTTNPVLEDRKARAAAIELCQRENRTTLYPQVTVDSAASPVPTASASEAGSPTQVASDPELCPPPSLIPLPDADTCTPCSRHAVCTPSSMTCENGYILRSHPLLYYVPVPDSSHEGQPAQTTFTRPESLFSTDAGVPQLVYSVVSSLLDGMPGLGPVAFPPRCVEDPRRKRRIGALGRRIDQRLSQERGRRLCDGIGAGEPEGDQFTEAKLWGVELGDLKEMMKKTSAPNLLHVYNDTFNEAINQLVDWGGVFMVEGKDGTRYIAHKNPSLDWQCVLKVQAREAWAEWRTSVMGSALFVLSVLVIKRRRAQSATENDHIASLVQIALDLLRNQELAHHTDPVTAPQPYLSSLQLRDLILQDEHSVSARRRLWDRVERVVESNSNVRTNLEEVESGDELRVWRWVGSARKPGAPSGVRGTGADDGTVVA